LCKFSHADSHTDTYTDTDCHAYAHADAGVDWDDQWDKRAGVCEWGGAGEYWEYKWDLTLRPFDSLRSLRAGSLRAERIIVNSKRFMLTWRAPAVVNILPQ